MAVSQLDHGVDRAKLQRSCQKHHDFPLVGLHQPRQRRRAVMSFEGKVWRLAPTSTKSQFHLAGAIPLNRAYMLPRRGAAFERGKAVVGKRGNRRAAIQTTGKSTVFGRGTSLNG
jgi:hypothetical protein